MLPGREVLTMADWKKILIAVDESPLSERVADYVGRVVSGHEGVDICLLQVYPEPPPYFYQEGHNLKEFQQEKESTAQKVFQRLLPVLEGYGFAPETIQTSCHMADGVSLSKEILVIREQGDFGTVVLGRRGISKAEEFLFGSISTAILRESHNFTVWVVS
ncbi:MAG: universal stress protein [Desulfobulbaceae bacterium]|uniref:Universal stress protein n=1 Tax=Candidatus Desulfatifera sulfidica TaxID=2841691 RepID=A0A8J6N894_9BACT|nr:universal stress protein [Candidatus Desulfatifera sulfidica]